MKIGLLLISLTLLLSCGSPKIATVTEESGQIPPGFGKDRSTLIGLGSSGIYNGHLKRKLKKYYPHDHVIVKSSDDLDKMYSDLDKYRYMFTLHYKSSNYVPNVNASPRENISGSYAGSHFAVIDRKTNKMYRLKREGGLVYKNMAFYLKALAAARQ